MFKDIRWYEMLWKIFQCNMVIFDNMSWYHVMSIWFKEVPRVQANFWIVTICFDFLGFYSFRRGTGSWFITALCQMLQMYSTEMDLLSLLTKVNHQVAYQFESNRPSVPMMHRRHVVPWVASMLTKEVWFRQKDDDDRRVVFVWHLTLKVTWESLNWEKTLRKLRINLLWRTPMPTVQAEL